MTCVLWVSLQATALASSLQFDRRKHSISCAQSDYLACHDFKTTELGKRTMLSVTTQI